MTRTILRAAAALLAVLALSSSAPAALQGKHPKCGEWQTLLADLEANGASELRLRRLRNRIADRCVAINEMQVLGSHNSYHIQPAPDLFAVLTSFDSQFLAWEYTHLPLPQQFDTQGIRQIELDVFADPDGFRFYVRHGLLALNQEPISGILALTEPGFKVLHIQDLDFNSTCLTFVECLKQVRQWSTRHRRHLPLMILIEAKDDPIPDPLNLGFVTPVPIGAAEMDAIDAEIRSVFPRQKLITPDDVRRGQPTLEDAILNLGWPTLRSARGKVMFMLDNGDSKRTNYLNGHPSLSGRVMFTDSTPGNPEAAFIKMNDPLDATIDDRVAAGYVVRTRADADTNEARSGDTVPRDAALASGAQWVSSDYPVPNPDFGTGYFVSIPGGSPARCNPVNAPPGCRSQALERLP